MQVYSSITLFYEQCELNGCQNLNFRGCEMLTGLISRVRQQDTWWHLLNICIHQILFRVCVCV